MARVAIVTGGTRGIGHAISVALKTKGFRVAANYAGNDKAAQEFQVETGIPVYKFNVGDYEATAAGLKMVERDVGPIDVVVNNAGITRDGMLHRMTVEQWNEVISVDLSSLFNMVRPVIDGMRSRILGTHQRLHVARAVNHYGDRVVPLRGTVFNCGSCHFGSQF